MYALQKWLNSQYLQQTSAVQELEEEEGLSNSSPTYQFAVPSEKGNHSLRPILISLLPYNIM